MGVDISLHIEIQINGRWEHYGQAPPFRDYALFSLMACGWSCEPIVEPRGLPDDMNAVTRVAYDQEQTGYRASWLTSHEVAELVRRYTDQIEVKKPFWSTDYFGYLFFSESWTEVELPEGATDFRFVFWFDN